MKNLKLPFQYGANNKRNNWITKLLKAATETISEVNISYFIVKTLNFLHFLTNISINRRSLNPLLHKFFFFFSFFGT